MHFTSFSLVHNTFALQMLHLFSISDRICTFVKTDTPSLHHDGAKFWNQGGFVLNILCCLKLWKLPWCCVIYALCMELWLHTKCLRWKIDQRWRGEERTGEQAESRWWCSIQFKCILLVLTHHAWSSKGTISFLRGVLKADILYHWQWIQSGFLKHWTLGGKFFQCFRFAAIMVIAAALTSLKNAECVLSKFNGNYWKLLTQEISFNTWS